MTESPLNVDNPENSAENAVNDRAQEFLIKLRQKQGNWVEWGTAIAHLIKVGYNPQEIFEETGFEPIQQNQVVVGAQVYHSLAQGGASVATQEYYSHKSSDVLYELRLLTGAERAAAADLTFIHKIDADEARDIAKAIKDFSRLPVLPTGFTANPGDAVAYQAWKLARQNSDLPQRTRLIAKGLRFAHSQTARQQLEQLLVDLSVTPVRLAPSLPVYRLESDEHLPRILPVVGELPLTPAEITAVPLITEIGPFGIVKHSGEQAWVAVPGWQVLLNAEDPVVIIASTEQFPKSVPSRPEPVLVVVDRAQRIWDISSYFMFAQDDRVDFRWFETAPEIPLLGKIIVIVRPKKILDEEITKDSWQIDE
jgi:hypothetical protein